MDSTASVEPRSKISLLFYRFYRVFVDTIRGFIEDDCYAKASALTFYALLSIVPVLAVLFGIAKGFGFEKSLESEILERFSEQPEVASKLIQFAYSWLRSVQGGVIAGIGTVLLFWSVVGLLNNIEAALNAIWKTKIGRAFTRKISDYLAVMIIAPLLLVTTSSINLYITTQLSESQSNVIVHALSPYVLFLLKFFPFFLVWVLFSYIYIFMPNTKVYIPSAIIAGILAGTAFQLWQWIYIKFQIGAASYGAIYGSFAALPLFLIWLQISWLIVLAGAEVAVQLENDLFVPNRILLPMPAKTAALLMTYRIEEAFAKGSIPLTDKELATELGMSLNHVHTLIESLKQAGILSEVSFQDKTYGYQPSRSVQTITMKNVCDAVDKSHMYMASVLDTEELKYVENYLEKVDSLVEKTENVPVYPMMQK